jgi:hypothetical protein
MNNYRNLLLLLVAAVCLLTAAKAVPTKTPPLYPVGEIMFTTTSITAGIGEASGWLTYGRNQILINMKNLKFKTKVGSSKFKASGKVYNLRQASNIFGKYAPIKGKIAIHGEVSGVLVRNEKGVIIDLRLVPVSGLDKLIITGFNMLPK